MPEARLSPLDASFLAVESETAHMHVGWAAVLDPPREGPAPSFEDLRDHIASRLPRAPRYRQMIRPVPLGLNAPAWVDDPDFDVSRHVLPAASQQLSEAVEECMSEPLGRDHPLWQFRIAERLEDGRIAVIGKAHHCMVDGIAAVELGSLLLDAEPEVPHPEPDDWEPAPAPDSAKLTADALTDFLRGPLSLAALPARVLSSPQRARGFAERLQRASRALLDAARPANKVRPLNQPISSLRHLGRLGRPVEDLLRVKRAFEVKLNDVVLAAAAGGVRRFLKDRGHDPIPLKAMVPVNVRDEGEAGALGNRISFMFIDLPCDEPDPVRRLQRVHTATSQRKQAGGAEGADTILRSVSLAPPPLQRFVSQLAASPQAFNLAVSNIPGPQGKQYMRGCRLAEVYPVVPLADRHALSIGMTTASDGAFFGLYADREALPEVDELADHLDSSIDELLELSDAQPEPVPATVGA
jgi:WS/DGAT/MGAT family acyltransferase